MKYDDILNLKRPNSKYPKASISSRAAQFSPFAALTGYEDKIKEIQRRTETKIELDENMKEIINYKINYLKDKNDNVTITYFVKDKIKDGGKYIDITGIIKKIDFNNKTIKIDNNIIKIEDILDIEI